MIRLALLMMPPLRWIRALRLLAAGIRVHPNAVILGTKHQLRCASGVKLGSHVSMDPGSRGEISIDAGVWISSGVEMQTDSIIRIGQGTSIQRRSTVNGSVRIGRECILAPNVFISSGTHPFREIPHLSIREQERRLFQKDGNLNPFDHLVWVQDDCWLGTNVVICPGVIVGKGAVIGANSVVNKDIPPYSVAAGCPAKLVGKRLEWAPKSSVDVGLEEDHPYLLDAHLVRRVSGYVALLSNSTTLLAALRKPDFIYSVSVEWKCQNGFYWTIAGKNTYQEPGSGQFIISSDEMETEGDIVYCQISIESKTDKFSSVEISKISIN
jgi:acetyltransferase-like isoleucine patch superfamily enzyme